MTTILSGLRDRINGSGAASRQSGDENGSAQDAQQPFADYNSLDTRGVVDALSQHSQVELEAVERYERSHKNREPVLDKLRYMRGREPFDGYDTLSTAEIVAALDDADLTTIKRVRGYERKFSNRRDVLEAAADVHRRRLAAEPAASPPAYQPQSSP